MAGYATNFGKECNRQVSKYPKLYENYDPYLGSVLLSLEDYKADSVLFSEVLGLLQEERLMYNNVEHNWAMEIVSGDEEDLVAIRTVESFS